MLHRLLEKLKSFIGGFLSVAIPAFVIIVFILTLMATDINLDNAEKFMIGAIIGVIVGGVISYYVLKRTWSDNV